MATRARSQDLTQLVRLVDQGLLRVPTADVFTLDRSAEAHRLAEGAAAGKVTIEVAPPSGIEPVSAEGPSGR